MVSKKIGIQDSSIFSKGSLVEEVAINYREGFKEALKQELIDKSAVLFR